MTELNVNVRLSGIFPAGENDYIALLPLEGEAAEQDEVYLYRYVENDGQEPSLLNIESDEEYDWFPKLLMKN